MLHKLGIVERMMILYHSAALLISKSPRDYIDIPTAGLAGIPPTAEATLHLVISGEATICYTYSE
jgi:hypothetical protein